jgi:hypothetical protein
MFLRGVQCQKKLTLDVFHPELRDPVEFTAQFRMRLGTEVGVEVRRRASYSISSCSFGYEKWVYSRRVEPGETVDLTEFYHCTRGVCGNGEWFYFTHLALLKDTPECQQYFRADEEPPEELRISIPNPCE